jgi:outer membrane protein assembly factor BamB
MVDRGNRAPWERTGTATTGVIDLGERRVPPAPYASSLWSRARLRRQWRRWRYAVKTTATVLSALTVIVPGASPPVSPLLQVAQRGPGVTGHLVVGDVLLIANQSGAEPPVWSAHQLPTGDYLWTTTDRLALDRSGQPPLGPVLTTPSGGGDVIHARDPATGRVLWSSRRGPDVARPQADVSIGDTLGPIPGTGLFLQGAWRGQVHHVDGQVIDFGPHYHHHVAVVSGVDGTVQWSDRSTDGWRLAYGGSAVVLLDRSGTVIVRDPRTGRTRASGTLPEPEPDSLHVVGDSIVTTTLEGFTWVVGGYAVDSLTPRWRKTVDITGSHDILVTTTHLLMSDGSASTLVDFRDGREYTVPGRYGGGVRLLAETVVFMSTLDSVGPVVDRGSGRVIADMRGWRLVEPATGSPGHLLFLHPVESDGLGAGRHLARLDLATGELGHLGRLPAVVSGCEEFRGGVVCRDPRLSLWRWR